MQRIGSSIAYHEVSSVRMSLLPIVHPIGIRVRYRALRASQGAVLTHWWNGMALSRGMVIRWIEPPMVNHGTKKGRGDNELHHYSARAALLLTSRVYMVSDSDPLR